MGMNNALTPTAAKPNPQANAGGGVRECKR